MLSGHAEPLRCHYQGRGTRPISRRRVAPGL